MAHFRCRACGAEGEFEYRGPPACPTCGSPHVQVAIAVEELLPDDPLFGAFGGSGDDGARTEGIPDAAPRAPSPKRRRRRRLRPKTESARL